MARREQGGEGRLPSGAPGRGDSVGTAHRDRVRWRHSARGHADARRGCPAPGRAAARPRPHTRVRAAARCPGPRPPAQPPAQPRGAAGGPRASCPPGTPAPPRLPRPLSPVPPAPPCPWWQPSWLPPPSLPGGGFTPCPAGTGAFPPPAHAPARGRQLRPRALSLPTDWTPDPRDHDKAFKCRSACGGTARRGPPL